MGNASNHHTRCTKLTLYVITGFGSRWILLTAVQARFSSIWALAAFQTRNARLTGAKTCHLLAVIAHRSNWITIAWGTAALLICYNASEVPETRLTPVTLQPPYSRFTRTLASGGITSTPVGAMLVTLAAAWASGQSHTKGSSDIVGTTSIHRMTAMWDHGRGAG